jgi:hypothetical protein
MVYLASVMSGREGDLEQNSKRPSVLVPHLYHVRVDCGRVEMLKTISLELLHSVVYTSLTRSNGTSKWNSIASGASSCLESILHPATHIASGRTRKGETWTIHARYSLEQGIWMGTAYHRSSTGAQGRSIEWCHAVRCDLLRGNEGRLGQVVPQDQS